ncbi:MAG: FAD-dependent oxidoreductase [Gammaproteobacteria bacterium]|nr:FAD-dependent oxidoreductase [Gammaproteobacteria bacterium]
MNNRLVIVGHGNAGARAVSEVLTRAPDQFKVTVIGEERGGSYNRVLLSSLLAGDRLRPEIDTHDRAWFAEHGVDLIDGDPVIRIDRAARQVVTASGLILDYDRLLLATGSRATQLPLPGVQLPGVQVFRTLDDVETLVSATASGSSAVVIGGGLLGLEAACGLTQRGMKVTLVHRSQSLMTQQLDARAGTLLQRALEARGIRFCLGRSSRSIEGSARVEALQLDDGTRLPADLLVMAVGIQPNVELARASGLTVDRGIVVDDQLHTSDPRIDALGECVQHRGVCYGLVAPLYQQAEIFARRLAGDTAANYHGSLTTAQLKVSGIDLFSAGEFDAEGAESLIFNDPRQGIYRRLNLRHGCVVGALLYGDVTDAFWFQELIETKRNISAARPVLLFGRGLAESRLTSEPESRETEAPQLQEFSV